MLYEEPALFLGTMALGSNSPGDLKLLHREVDLLR